MSNNGAGKRRRIQALLVSLILISSVTVGVFTSYALQPVSIPLEVKEPLEILNYPSSFSLYPGETATLTVTVQNLASVTYFVALDFRLNDTQYQTKYVTFSANNYSVVPGTQDLTAWLTVAPNAPPASLLVTVSLKDDTEDFTPTPEPSLSPSPAPSANGLNPSLQLLGAGAKWAAGNGTKVLYIDYRDCWDIHHLTDGKLWEWGVSESVFAHRRSMVLSALQQAGLEVDCAGDIPADLSGYDVVLLEAYYAIEPRHEPLIRQYVQNGGGLVLISATAGYLATYSKTLNIGTDFTSIQDWLGCGWYVNAGGTARTAADNPFGTPLLKGDQCYFTSGGSAAGFAGLDSDATAVAFWNSGVVFAFTHEYGSGRVYYQAQWQGE
jgi:hypothetical protein